MGASVTESNIKKDNHYSKPIPVVQNNNPFKKAAGPLRFALDPFVFMRQLNRTYGEIVTLPGKQLKFTFVFTPELTRQLLTNPTLFHNGEVDDTPFPLPQDSAMRRLTQTLNTINDARHKQQRRLMMPSFHRKRIEGYHADMVELTQQKLAEWRPGENRDLLREMKQLTLSIALKTLLGLDPTNGASQPASSPSSYVNNSLNVAPGEGETTRQVVEEWLKLGSNITTLLLPYDIPGLPYHRTLKLASSIEHLLKSLIALKRASGLKGDDVLTSLIQARTLDEDKAENRDEHSSNTGAGVEVGVGFSEEELVAETLALFVAGHETTATALTWTLFLLMQHPAVLADLVDEMEGTLHGGFPDLDQLAQNKLPLLERVIKESMRTLSPFLFGFRYATADCTLGEYFVPKGTRVAFAPSVIHHLPEIYPEPEKFKPERWETLEVGPYDYLPFAAGPRMCIGASFALSEIKIVLAGLLQQYRLSMPQNLKVDRAGFLLTYPRKGLPVLLHKHDHQFTKTGITGNIHTVVTL